MYQDVVDLHAFYRTRLGQSARMTIRRRLRQIWPDLRGQRLMGLGYATPYLRPFLKEAERVCTMMPARQGCILWPPEGPNRVVLAEATGLPFADSLFDRVLLIHALEHEADLRRALREVWRVLAPDGRMVAITPNRSSPWSWYETTPFGHGMPYSARQLEKALCENMFLPIRRAGALFMPPTRRQWMLRIAGGWEKLGQRYFSAFGGVTLMEAGKQLHAATGARGRRRNPAPVPAASLREETGGLISREVRSGARSPREDFAESRSIETFPFRDARPVFPNLSAKSL